jgi:replicative DNA helicase
MTYDDLDLSILKTITTNKKHALDFVNDGDPKLFATPIWQFATTIVNHIKIYGDVPTIRVLLESTKNKTLSNHLAETWKIVQDFAYDEREYKHDLSKLKGRYADLELSKLSDKLLKARDNHEKIDVSAYLSDIQKIVFNIKSLNQTKAYDRKTLKETVDIFRDEFNAKLSNPNFNKGIATGYSFLDEATGGLNNGELILIAGESASGKSILLMNLAIQMWMQGNKIEQVDNFSKGFNVLYFSLEMPLRSMRDRMYACLSGIPSNLIRNPVNKEGKTKFNVEQRGKLKTALQFIKNYPHELEIIDLPRGATASQIEALYEDAKTRFTPDIIIIDYLGIMDDEKGSDEDDWLKLGKITGALHEICRIHNVVMLSAVQLNRTKASGKDAEDRVGLHRIGRSALIMTHANVGIQIETRPNEDQFPDMLAHLIKNRDGAKGKGKLLKNLACGQLTDNSVSSSSDDVGVEFTDVDDLTDEMEMLDI